MPPRYRITLEAASTDADYEQAASTLEVITGSKRGEVEFWLRNLPHTITASASESNGRNLVDTFASLGFEMGCTPKMPPMSHEEKTGHREYKNIDFNLSSSRKFSSRKGLYLSILIISVIVLSFGLSLFIAMKLIQSRVNPTKEDVADLLKNGQYARAKALMAAEIQKGGGSSDDYLNLAKARITRIRNLGRQSNWRKHLTSVSWDDDLETLRNYFISKEGNDALTELKKAADLNPRNAEARKWLGILHHKRRELNDAESAFNESLSLQPGDVELLNFLALVQIDKKNYQKAESSLKEALHQAPNNIRTLKNMGTFQLYHKKDTALALRYYQKYMKIDPGVDFERPVIREEITRVLWNRYFPTRLNNKLNPRSTFSDFEAKRKQLTKSLKKNKTDKGYDELGDVFAERGMYQEAIIQWLQALKLNPERHDISRKLFRVQGNLGQFSSAKGTLQNTLKQGASEPDLVFALGLLNKYYSEDKPAAVENFNTYLRHRGAWSADAQLELEELKRE